MKEKLKQNKVVRFCYYLYKLVIAAIKSPFLRHEKGFSKYKDIHKGKRCFIVATGPSLTSSDLEMLKGEITFSMNSIMKSFDKTSWRPTYYVITDKVPYEACKDLVDKNDYEQIFFRKGIEDSNKDICHFSVNVVEMRKCHIKDRFKDNLFPSKKLDKYFNDGPSVVFSIIQLAMYMGFTEIYLLGQDCNYDGNLHSDIASLKYKIKPTSKNAFIMLETFENYATIMNECSIKIFNATRGGKLEAFPRVSLEEIIKEKKNEDSMLYTDKI
ncbi:MAG: motility associated factor glycosyltransferase family protein [Clostridia bacterium]|nr:motility associated factor glycosyltransferase family protein [Clostridia bacterium]